MIRRLAGELNLAMDTRMCPASAVCSLEFERAGDVRSLDCATWDEALIAIIKESRKRGLWQQANDLQEIADVRSGWREAS